MCLLNKKIKNIQIKFGVPFFDLFDPRFEDFAVPVAVRGSVSFQIKNFKKFLKQQGYTPYDLENFQTRIRNAVTRYVKESIVNIPIKYKIPVWQIERKLEIIGDIVKSELYVRVKKEFKIQLTVVDITAIEIDKYSEGYQQLKTITQDVTTATILTETEIKLQNVIDKQRVDMENYEEKLKIERNDEVRKLKKLIPLCVVGGIIIIALIAVIIYLL